MEAPKSSKSIISRSNSWPNLLGNVNLNTINTTIILTKTGKKDIHLGVWLINYYWTTKPSFFLKKKNRAVPTDVNSDCVFNLPVCDCTQTSECAHHQVFFFVCDRVQSRTRSSFFARGQVLKHKKNFCTDIAKARKKGMRTTKACHRAGVPVYAKEQQNEQKIALSRWSNCWEKQNEDHILLASNHPSALCRLICILLISVMPFLHLHWALSLDHEFLYLVVESLSL
jgi:hypothetical protein